MPNDEKKDEDKPKEDAVRASLVTASESDDPKKAARAKAALSAYDEDKDEKAATEDKPASAAVPDDDEKKALKATVAALSASVKTMQDEQKAQSQARAAAERSAFLASRPDLTKDQLAAFEKLPFESLKAIVATLPPPREFSNPLVTRAQSSVNGAEHQHVSSLPQDVQSELDQRMGITKATAPGVRMNGIVQEFGVQVAPAVSVK